MRVLVTYGSKRGGTEGIAATAADELRKHGADVDVTTPGAVREVDGYAAVVIGGALYMGRWNRDARAFVKQHARALRGRPIFFFSSGPLDDSAIKSEIPPTGQVRRLMRQVGAREHATFGGRLLPDAQGFAARAMAEENAGDWRDTDQVRAWARHVASEIQRVAVA